MIARNKKSVVVKKQPATEKDVLANMHRFGAAKVKRTPGSKPKTESTTSREALPPNRTVLGRLARTPPPEDTQDLYIVRLTPSPVGVGFAQYPFPTEKAAKRFAIGNGTKQRRATVYGPHSAGNKVLLRYPAPIRKAAK